MEEKLTFGKFISKKRKEAELTQRDLADQLFVTESAVSKWERGISYPDITLVSAICKTLGITEHELITASEDTMQRKVEKQAQRFRRIVDIYRKGFMFVYLSSLLICFICNLVIDHTLSWFFVVLGGEAIAFSLTVVPMLVEEYKGIKTLGAFYLSLNLLFVICRILYGGNWLIVTMLAVLLGFMIVFLPIVLRQIRLPRNLEHHKTLLCFSVDTILIFVLVTVTTLFTASVTELFAVAYPVTIISLLLAWIYMLVIRYTNLNNQIKASICLAVGAVYVVFINEVLHIFTDGAAFKLLAVDFTRWNDLTYLDGNIKVITGLIMMIAALVLLIGGVASDSKRKNN
ncbi:helix-turn-helix domain-containing protein [Breznakia pachnodae]|uniref:Transcriptional regulator with XRE-family HTH domain n=1 Tax=Breznakia pachnodae TaxID=265178 RepID=A0ABU0E1G3_9FIRM|nr:helix-turn-helix transcriptional regulator [Breznakia pachnodae]MDQ0360718.1 transcriptional regulator with XRE-family HTH domain [Breznakia pachnodae]